MKKMFYVFLSFVFTLPLFAQKNLTLDEAISIALQRNTQLIKSKNQLESSQTQVKNAYGELLPTVGAQGQWNWQRINDVGGAQRDYLGNNVIVPPSEEDSRYYSVGVGGSLTLFDGLSNIANINQKQDNLKAAEYNLEKMKQNIVFQTTDYFYSILNAQELMKVREDNVKYYEKFFETVQERNKLGSVAKADVYTAQVQLGNAELQLIQAQNAYETALSNLLNYLGLNVLEEYKLVDPFGGSKTVDTDTYMKDFADIGVLVSGALDTRFDFKGQELLLKAAESGITMARSGLLPSLTGNYSYSTSAINVNNLFDRKVLSFGMTLSIPIFSNWSTENQIQFAQVSYKNAQEDLSALERQIKIEVKQGYLDLVAAKKSLDVSTKSVTAAEETRKINQERYNLGSGTILDVLQADRDYTEALRNKINATYDFYSKRDKLNNALGKLDSKKFE
jgi:outer membrane protein